ncbi:MAG: SOS response-associated peptidase family protein [Thermodesulfobacteriota bacterium]
MLVILPKDNGEIWLNPESNEAELKELLVPFDSSKMDMYQVGEVVNSWKNDIIECFKKINEKS